MKKYIFAILTSFVFLIGVGASQAQFIGSSVSVTGLPLISADGTPVSIPDGFSWTPDFEITQNGDGSFATDYNYLDDKPSGTTKYVVSEYAFNGTSQTAGSDSNDGNTYANAYATLDKARQAGANVIVIDGMFHKGNGFAAHWNSTVDVAVEGYNGNTALITGADMSGSFALHSGSAYVQSGVTGIENVIDRSVTVSGSTLTDGSTGSPTTLTEVGSVASVISTAGTWHDDGVDTYVHASDSRNLTSDTDIVLLSDWAISNHTNDVTWWFSNVEFWGDRGVRIDTADTNTAKLVGYKMASRWSIDTNAYNLVDLLDVRLVESHASDSKTLDGFNYHRGSSAVNMRILEYNCVGERNGTGSTDNASTTHDEVYAIRLNGTYRDQAGVAIADTDGSEVLNFGVTIGNTSDDGFNVGTYSGSKPAMVWYKNVTSENAVDDFVRSTGGMAFDMGGNTFATVDDDSDGRIDYNDATLYEVAIRYASKLSSLYSMANPRYYANVGGEVNQLFDLSAQKNKLTTPTTRPTIDLSYVNGYAAMDFGSSPNEAVFDSSKSTDVKHIFFVGDYDGGSDNTFDDLNGIINNNSGSRRIVGDTGTADLYTTGTDNFAETVSVNGAAASVVMLPTGFGHFKFTSTTAAAESATWEFFGDNSNTNRGWQGGVHMFYTLDADPSAGDESAIQATITTSAAVNFTPIISGIPSISGTDEVGETLTATAASVEGLPTPTQSWQWERSGTPISGATSITYDLVEADAGNTITVVQTETNSEGSDTAESSATTTITSTPQISGVPTLSGTEAVGNVLTASAASATGYPAPTTSWQWERDGTPIGGATSSTYTLVSADDGAIITVVQTETNTEGSDTAESAGTGAIKSVPSIAGVPTISGSETVGSVLTATASGVTGTPTPTRTWQWERSGVDISGATSSTYTLVGADETETLTVTQTETNSEGVDSAESAATGVITAAASDGLSSLASIGSNVLSEAWVHLSDSFASNSTETFADFLDDTNQDFWNGEDSGATDNGTISGSGTTAGYFEATDAGDYSRSKQTAALATDWNRLVRSDQDSTFVFAFKTPSSIGTAFYVHADSSAGTDPDFRVLSVSGNLEVRVADGGGSFKNTNMGSISASTDYVLVVTKTGTTLQYALNATSLTTGTAIGANTTDDLTSYIGILANDTGTTGATGARYYGHAILDTVVDNTELGDIIDYVNDNTPVSVP